MRRPRTIRRRGLLLACSLLLAAGRTYGSAYSPLVVDTRRGPVRFVVETVDTPATRAHGLMFRQDLPADHGMLFDFHEVQPVAFWMKDTLIPLDMLFIDPLGTILHIHADARPHDETPVPSVYPILAVLEIKGGEAARRGISEGDRIHHAIFRN